MNRVMVSVALVAAIPAILVASIAQAHAVLDRTSPANGSTVSMAPATVSLRFTDELEPAFSTVQVIVRSGKRVDFGDAKVDPSDPTRLRATLHALSPGTYKVIWHVVAVDTHRTGGDFTFTVAP